MTRPEHYRSYSAVFPILLREGANGREVLLHLRQNTGYMDGCWDFAGSGHVDENETARQAVARECLEELGITVNPADAEFVHLCHRVAGGDGRTYYDLCFVIRKYDGTPTVMEPNKNAGLRWFPTEALPENTSTAVGGHAAPLSAGASLTVRSFMTFRSHQSKKEEITMSIQKVREYFKQFGIEDRIREFDVSSATVELAAVAVGVEGARIAKSMSFKVGEEPIIIVVAGDAKVDNSRYKAQFHTKAKMLTFEEAHTMIGHDPGGVCSFALPDNVKPIWTSP